KGSNASNDGFRAKVFNNLMVSLVFLPIGPEVHSNLFMASPSSITTLVLGLNPITLLNAAGFLNDPIMSPPSATGNMRVPRAHAAPPRLPPAVREGSYALPVVPNTGLYGWEPRPNSGVLVFPMKMAPWLRIFVAMAPSWSAMRFANMGEPSV